MKFLTPMMQQYEKIKSEYPDCLLFFRLGDFYELFLEDAEIGSRILDITLTARNKGKDGKIPMCGVPFHAIDSYLAKIVKAGYKAAICEQVSEPGKGTEIVEREVIRIITPGTIVDENMLERKSNNFTLTLSILEKSISFAFADISTGEFLVNYITVDTLTSVTTEIINQIKKINPSEIVLQSDLYNNFELIRELRKIDQANIFPLKPDPTRTDVQLLTIKNFFNIKSLQVFGIDESKKCLIDSIYNLLSYLKYTQNDNLFHIKSIKNHTTSSFIRIDPETYKNLEIFESFRTNYASKKTNSVYDIIDRTKTPMGGRLLKTWLTYPSKSLMVLNKRHNAVDYFIRNHTKRDNISEDLSRILDIERLLSKLGTNTANARDLMALAISIERSLNVLTMLISEKDLIYEIDILNIEKIITPLTDIKDKIKFIIKEDPPFSVKEGGLIKDNVSNELDEIKSSISDSQNWIAQLEIQERIATGLSTLKVGFNSVFGYYIEVSRSNSHLVPSHYVRKQTLVNAERYITQELKAHEDVVLNAKEKIDRIEYEVFINLVAETLKEAGSMQELARAIANIDCLIGFADLALTNNYTRPILHEASNYDFMLTEARHPVVEKVLNPGEFTPNSTILNKKSRIHIITGPNMSGKSTYIRQLAIIQMLAQIGSYVPADRAEISLVDGIYTRIGSGDALSQGLSTFMVEMIETAKILNNTTEHSLIILDEVGRGTSTIDGYSIARSVVEYIHNKIGAKTLFATHFHELINLDQRLKKVENYHIKVSEENGEIKFTHKVDKGGTNKSYGIEVAKLAGIPEEVVNRAREILTQNSTSQLKLDF